ncbi:tyrosine-type recombinase/integrase [Paraburkholderia silviterrae]|uniref:Site-specific integrase n=1 Tax=Paraburkholderia silviterrae TaxID=2528715 RepID=A0A4R5M9J5_9BURK|nr:site-specific integrase [Paraburkholderia silviterrae]TDG23273.1 site-specific integrase [Paraburkholderia silviterrae]
MGRKGTGVKPISDSSYEITFPYKGIRCRERVKAKPSAANTRALIKFRQRILFAIEDGSFDYAQSFPNSKNIEQFAKAGGDVLTVATYLENWLEVKQTQIAASTARDYRGIIFGLFIPEFGGVPLHELTRAELKLWLAKIDEGREKKITNKRLSNIQSCVRSAFEDAVEDEILEANPLAGFTFARNEPPRDIDHADPLDADEQAAVITAARDPQIANLWQFMFWTGMRTSEVIALDWGDVDWQRETIRVRKAITRAAKGVVEDTKTVAGRRDVKLLAPAMAALLAQKAHTFLEGNAIFHSPGWRGRGAGRWKDDHQIWDAWKSTLKKAKVRYRNPYQTRHTYASMMLSAGEREIWVAKQMGHSDTTSIRRNYGRWIPSSDPNAGGKAVALFASENAGKKAGKSTRKLAKNS